MDTKNKGIYTIILELHKDSILKIGKLGNINFLKGYYAYTGSARGYGGFKRVKRHLDVSSKRNSILKWHIDYLLHETKVIGVILTPTNLNLECTIANDIIRNAHEIKNFGCSNCSCSSHLAWKKDLEILDIAIQAHKKYNNWIYWKFA